MRPVTARALLLVVVAVVAASSAPEAVPPDAAGGREAPGPAPTSQPPPRGREPRPSTQLSGRATFGQRGALRIVLRAWHVTRDHAGPIVSVALLNEGEEEVRLQPKDRWTFRLADGSQVIAKPSEHPVQAAKGANPSAIPPHGVVDFLLTTSRALPDEIEALEFESASLGLTIAARRRYAPPVAQAILAPTYPPAALAAAKTGSVRLGILVGAGGRPDRVIVLPPIRHDDPFAFQRAAIDAVRQWTFAAATEDGIPCAGLLEETIVFSHRAIVARLPLPLAEAGARIDRFLRSAHALVVALPGRNAFAAAGHPRREAGFATVEAYLVRLGEEEPGRSSRVTVSAVALRTRQAERCNCVEWLPPPAPEAFLRRLGAEFGLTEVRGATLAAQHRAGTPSGLPEPAASGEWSRAGLRRLLLLALEAGPPSGSERHPDGSFPLPAGTGAAAAVLPGEADLLPADEPVRWDPVMHTTPERVHEVKPRYPPAARGDRREGRVVIEAVIDRDGNVDDLRRLLASDPSFIDAAMEAVCCWKYRPATRDGIPVPVEFIVLVEFTLR